MNEHRDIDYADIQTTLNQDYPPPTDKSDGTAVKTHDIKLESWQSESKHSTSRSQMLPTILNS